MLTVLNNCLDVLIDPGPVDSESSAVLGARDPLVSLVEARQHGLSEVLRNEEATSVDDEVVVDGELLPDLPVLLERVW